MPHARAWGEQCRGGEKRGRGLISHIVLHLESRVEYQLPLSKEAVTDTIKLDFVAGQVSEVLMFDTHNASPLKKERRVTRLPQTPTKKEARRGKE